MLRTTLTGLTKKRLRWWLLGFFIVLCIPTLLLIDQAYSELKWEAFHQHRVQAEELTQRIDGQLLQLINREESRPFSDYNFLNIAGATQANFLQRSPLSAYPVDPAIPGLIGYFQVDAGGAFTTPLLPAQDQASRYGITDEERQQRQGLQNRLLDILSANRLAQRRQPAAEGLAAGRNMTGQRETALQDAVTLQEADETMPAPAEEAPAYPATAPSSRGLYRSSRSPMVSQQAFDALEYGGSSKKVAEKKKQSKPGTLGRVEDLRLDEAYQRRASKDANRKPETTARIKAEKQALEKHARKEVSRLPVATSQVFAKLDDKPAPSRKNEVRVRTFESEIDPFIFSQLDSGHYVLYRKVWRDKQRYIQGLLIEQEQFIQGMIASAFENTALYRMSDLLVAWQGNVVSRFRGQLHSYLSRHQQLNGSLLYRTALSNPLDDMELVFSINRLPAGPGAAIINWLAAVLFMVMAIGFYLMYRSGAKQIELTHQQQDFVSAVSHELKTPLTSIRMYGEMLREGWADEEKKKTYYDFIFDESERLSRLINNVLQLARLSRNKIQTDIRNIRVSELFDMIRSRISSPIERAGFDLQIDCDEQTGRQTLAIDTDHFMQVMINLVDNALKFSPKADIKVISVGCRQSRQGNLQISVRDHGPGIPAAQMKKIFGLFYRAENELTRETIGTGIGLALVNQLVREMGGRIDVINTEPGVQFTLEFKVN